ncbi:MAG: hypothetical protein AAF788_00985 [Pseudomonadota bacterium]
MAVEREAMIAALERLEARPWDTPEEAETPFVTLLFGGTAPSARVQAKSYLEAIEADGVPTTLVVRRDLDESLTAAWNVAHVGRMASNAIDPVPSDLRIIEEAISQARQCRLIYAEALMIMMKESGDVDRNEVRRVKEQFTQAILELGRTADALTARLDDPRPASFVARQPSVLNAF